MDPAFVLIHSLSLGPASWRPVADRLSAAGNEVHVPSLLGAVEGPPPYWPRIVAAVTQTLEALPPDREVALVFFSNAGLYAPVLVEHATRPVRCCVLVDASLPERAGETPVASTERLAELRAMAVDGRLPPWSQWWDEADVAPLFPDAATRAEITAEEPRLPLDYYEQRIPVPSGWDATPCGYLLFGGFYEPVADEARRRGWRVDELPGLHLHLVVDPAGVARRLVAMTNQLIGSS